MIEESGKVDTCQQDNEDESLKSSPKRDSSLDDDPQTKRLKIDENKYESMQPRLKKFLKIYQLSSKNSLSGPNQSDLEKYEEKEATSSLSIIANVAVAAAAEAENEPKYIQKRIASPKPSKKSNLKYLKCIQADQDTSLLMETLLHGERISCFIVGGEKRLCLHDILNTILKDFSVQQINSACQKLSIACLESTPRQLEILKRNHLLPPGAPNCGLLTQTNSERLCAFLMDSTLSEPVPLETPPSSTSSSPASLTPTTLKVFHECFGKTYGHVHINMYSRYDSACIECDTCRKLYSPKNFVCHSHRNESSTRHWGFDSTNWRIYVKLSHSSEEKNVLTDAKLNNKDNIAANNSNKESNEIEKDKALHEEEFEMFKQKFSNIEQKVFKCSPRGDKKIEQPHKLLNGLLSKPVSSEIPLVQQFSNQPNIVIQNSSINMDSIKSLTPKSKLPTPKIPTSSTPNPMAYLNLLNPKYFNKTQYPFMTNSIELNMLECILNEIESSVSNKDSAERLRQLVTQMHSYFTEKLNDQVYLKSKYFNEFEEYKMSLQNENEHLKCQLKLFQIQNDFGKDSYLLKKNSNQTALNQIHTQKQTSSSSTSASPISSHSSTPSLTKTQAQTANTILQNILLLQNQQNNTQLAQSLPFLLNHYSNGIGSNLNSLLEPMTTPIKYNSKYQTSSTSKSESTKTQTSTTA